MHYQVHLIKDLERPGAARLVEFAHNDLIGQLPDKVAVYGVFLSLFGLASNEVYLVTCGETTFTPRLPGGMDRLRSHDFTPTIRPLDHEPRQEPGIYVFRWFSVNADDVDEIVRLSGEAWPEFEASFDTRVQGLFVEATEQPAQMLLITWYRNLAVWEASRHPPVSSRDNFLRRHQLTRQARPIATMLSIDESKGLVSHT